MGPKELQVLLTLSADAWDSGTPFMEQFGPKIEEAAARRGVPDMSTVKVEVRRESVINFGTEDDPDLIDIAEHNLVLVAATVMTVPHEGEIA